MKRPIDIYTNTYQRSHGRAPRGRGCWGFIVVDESGDREVATFFVPGSMTLADARVWAKSYVREQYAAELATGYMALEVAP